MILQNLLQAQANRPEIIVVKEYGQLPPIECYAGQLNQVFLNLLMNAIDAVEESLTTSKSNKISIADNGIGICDHIKPYLFDLSLQLKP